MNIAVCVPGSKFSGHFLDSWTDLISFFHFKGIDFSISRQESPNIYFARNLCLGADTRRGPNQKPFDGKLDYSHLLWIDSDMTFKPENLQALLEHDLDIVSGIYRTADNVHYATVEKCDPDYYLKNGHFEFLSDKTIKEKMMDVAYTGFGFMLIKRGVFEKLKYPWFRPMNFRLNEMIDICTEDVSFCSLVKELGFKIMVDTTVRLGHEKSFILQ